nr:hypothetical protein [Cardinium endosymbiont of Bemisia tabaci]
MRIEANTVEKYRREGEQKGRLEGEQKGRQEGIRIGQEKGILIGQEKGKIEGKMEIAKSMLLQGYSIEDIVLITGY